MRFDFYGKTDTPDTTNGDNHFVGIDMTRDLPLLAEGMLSLGENTRTRTGHVTQRRGTTQPGDFNPKGGIGALVGSSVFRNPNGEEVLIVAPRGATYTTVLRDGKDSYRVKYGGGVAGNNGIGRVDIVQAFEKVLLLRYPLAGAPDNLVWDGTGDFGGDGLADTDWEVTTLSPEGLKLVPAVYNGEPFMDRIIYYFSNSTGADTRDTWFMSDVLDYTSYDDVFQSFRTNAGEADYITRIMAYFRGSVVIFKNHSIHMATVQNTYPVTITQRILNSSLGSASNKMPLMIGGDIIFLSKPNGFYRLSEIIQDQITTLPMPISEPIQRVIDSINWSVTENQGCSEALDNYAFFGVCLQGKSDHGCLNAILVYDTQRKVWESAGDTWSDPNFCFNALHVTNYGGVHRLFAIDYLGGIVYLLYEGVNDELPNGTFAVPFKMKSRGYVGGDSFGFKRFGRATIGIQTSNPLFSVSAFTDGFNEEKLLTPKPITKDSFTYYSHGKGRFDPLTSDANAPYRQDYSVIINSPFAGLDYEAIPEGEVTFIPATVGDASTYQSQQSIERFLVRSHGQWCALSVENNQGTCEISSISVESTRSFNTNRTAA